MAEVIPVINVKTFEEAKDRLKKAEPYSEWAHVDVTDGIFTKHVTWHNAAELPMLDTSLKIEAHLMVEAPEKVIDEWLVAPVARVIVHLEATHDLDSIIQKCRAANVEIGLAINPETPWEELKPWFGKVDLVQVLAVSPGPSGQEIQEEAYEKIRHIREVCPSCIIEIDGGMNPETAKKAREAGVNLIASGAYLFNAPDIKKAIDELETVLDLV